MVEEDLFNTLPPEVKEQLWKADKEQAWAKAQWKAFFYWSNLSGKKNEQAIILRLFLKAGKPEEVHHNHCVASEKQFPVVFIGAASTSKSWM